MTTPEKDRDGVGLLEPMPPFALDDIGDPADAFRQPWLDFPGPSLANHPLLRGLLMELPPKTSPPSPEWMNQWFAAARAVFDLMYHSR
jgi:hypothetical protein